MYIYVCVGGELCRSVHVHVIGPSLYVYIYVYIWAAPLRAGPLWACLGPYGPSPYGPGPHGPHGPHGPMFLFLFPAPGPKQSMTYSHLHISTNQSLSLFDLQPRCGHAAQLHVHLHAEDTWNVLLGRISFLRVQLDGNHAFERPLLWKAPYCI